MRELDLEYKIIGKDKTVLVIETGIAENSDHEIYLDRPDIVIQHLKTLL